MTAEYDDIAEAYARSKLAPWRRFVERHTLFELLGPPAGLEVLDLACGSGFYSRLLRAAGASRVVGVDLSGGMVALARKDEETAPLGITYHVGDAATLDLGEQFDLVFAAYLFNYARSEADLLAMSRSVTRHLRPGGRLVAVMNNPDQTPDGWEAIRKYGYIKSAPLPPVNGVAITHTMFPADAPSFSFDNYYLSLPTHHRAFYQAGLRAVSWHLPRVSAEGETTHGTEFWEVMLADPPVIFLTAHKTGTGADQAPGPNS